MAYWQTHSPHKAKHECFCFYGACANPHTPEIANYRPDCLSHHKRHAAMAETKKATTAKTKSCYAVTRQAAIAKKLAGRKPGPKGDVGNISRIELGRTTVQISQEIFP